MVQARRTNRMFTPWVERLEPRDQPSAWLSMPFAHTAWLELDLGLWDRPHDAEGASLRSLLQQAEALAAPAHGGAAEAGMRAPTGAATPAVVNHTSAAPEAALLAAASSAAPPQLRSVTIDTSEDGLANPHPGYRVVTTAGEAGRSGPGNILYATYLGGPTADEIRAVALDPQGNVYLAGTIDSGDPGQGVEAFAAKMRPDGAFVYFTAFGGLGRDEANGVDVDPQGNAYVSGAFTNQFGTINAFVTKLNPDGDQFIWRRNVAGMPIPDGPETVFGNIRYFAPTNQVYYSGYVTAREGSTVVKAGGLGRMNAVNGGSGVALQGYRFLPPNEGDSVPAEVGVDAAGNGYVALGATRNQFGDTFWWFFKSRPNLTDPGFATPPDWIRSYVSEGAPFAMTVDAAGNSHAAGYFTTPAGRYLGLMRHGPTGQLVYQFSTKMVGGEESLGRPPAGGPRAEGRGVVVDAQGRVYITGTFTTADGHDDVFLTRITPRPVGSRYEFDVRTFTFGGPGNDRALGLAAQLPETATIVGSTAGGFPVTQDAWQPTYGGGPSDGFVARTRLPGA